ncbi:MAG: DUF1553 domain-containing protein [Dehalococcoidia bacterium]|jgi:mono/diheme cytochrome c family protein|nr:DUF1553 domain-containing protein [Dehalococcoidia bacterium]
MPSSRFWIGLLATVSAILVGLSPAAAQDASPAPVDFQREIRPILSDNCFQCHGPNAESRRADLRLDTEDGAFSLRPSGPAVAAGNPTESLVYQRITHENVRRRMPPAASNKTLTDEEIQLLGRWIEEGAAWDQHWAFTPTERPELPAVSDNGWIRTPVDRFVLARLDADGLTSAPEADRPTLARRVALDLTGLPPDPGLLEAFLNDPSDAAYDTLVSRLLDSPHWGEHRGRYWLDAARYGDTHGIHIDNYREMYPYRDWVIEAFNDNKPFDEFTVEQLAGDLLPEPTLSQLIATGFHRNNITTNEGGAITAEYEAVYAKDRADTTGTVFLGLTIGCATCHDHKFDPIAQAEFYAMTAFFRNTTQYVMDGNVADPPPTLVVPTEADRARWEALRLETPANQRARAARAEEIDAAFSGWLAAGGHRNLEAPLQPSAELLAMALGNDAPAGPAVETRDGPVPIVLRDGAVVGDGPDGLRAIRFEGESSAELPALEVDRDTPFALALWLFHPEENGNFVVVDQSDPEDGGRGWRVGIGERGVSVRLIGDRIDEGRREEIVAAPINTKRLEAGAWTHLVFSYDGSGERAGLSVFRNGEAIEQEGSEFFDAIAGSVRVDRPIVLGRAQTRPAADTDTAAPTANHFTGGAVADLRVFDRALTVEEARVVSLWPTLSRAREIEAAALDADAREALRLHYLSVEDERTRDLVAEAKALDLEYREIRRRGSVTHVMQERMDAEPEAHILNRGMYDQPLERVTPTVPAALPPMAASLPRNRLGLARWLVDAQNPLMTRVTVNRFWQQIFGTGLVRSSEDFGAQGEPPSHPALLDWLAVEFRESGWDVKRFYRMLVTSAVYRQSSRATAEKLERDPENRLLARGPRFRMDAEMVRDYALAASGLLVRTIGGPSVKPYQPAGVWSGVAMPQSNTRVYEADTGASLYRRSLYTFWKRSAPPASLEIFNAPTREHATVRRERTNTPLQALVTMNDPQFVEASRHLAQRALREAFGFEARLDYVTMRLLARGFVDAERAVARRTHDRLLEGYRTDTAAAEALLAVGDSRPDDGLPPDELATWTMVVNQLMNLDEVLNK